MEHILAIENVSKYFGKGQERLVILDQINLQVKKGEMVSIIGPSGSGKTTLLGLAAGLDVASEGNIWLLGENLTPMGEDQRARLRNEFVGFIFQNFQLIPTLTALENVMVPLELKNRKNALSQAKNMLDMVGLSHRIHHYPTQLSGGEQQRVAIARAFANEPSVLFADEPTGNLDLETSQKVEKLIFELNKEKKTTLVIVTHNPELAAKTDRTIQIKGGQVVSNAVNVAQLVS